MATSKTFIMPTMAIIMLFGMVSCGPAAVAVPDKNKADIKLNECMAGVNQDCGVIIAAWMMFGEMLPPSVECCTQLLDMGMECHGLLVSRLLENKRFKGTSDDVTRRSNELWEFCAFEKDFVDRGVDAPAPAPAFSF